MTNRRGAVSIEAALVTPMLVIILIGAIDVGQYVNIAQNVSNASREGARIACRNESKNVSDVENGVFEYLSNTFPQLTDEELNEALEVTVRNETGDLIVGASLAAVPSGSPISVEVSLEFDSVRWLQGVSFWTGEYGTTTTTAARQ